MDADVVLAIPQWQGAGGERGQEALAGRQQHLRRRQVGAVRRAP